MKNKRIALTNGIILDGTLDMVPIENKTILIENGKIVSIVDSHESFNGYTVIDLNKSYVMPGLINMHVHIPASGKPKLFQGDVKKVVKLITSNGLLKEIGIRMCAGYAKNELYGGTTTIRAVGGIQDFDSKLKKRINSGKVIGPRILASDMAITVPGGHMAGSVSYEAESVEDAVDQVRKRVESGADLIKLMITGGVLDATGRGEPGPLKMSPEYVKACCDEAHKHGMQVAAHVEGQEGLKVALENGVDSIEHGAETNDEIIELFKKSNAYHILTISPAVPFALFDLSVSHFTEEQQYNSKIVFDGVISCAKACLENGIKVGLGTDTGCPYVTHYDMWRELYYYHKYCGVSNNFALHTATAINAELLGLDSVIGTIEEGKEADLIVCKNNPLDDLTALRNLNMVIAKGTVVDISGLKKFDEVELELDKIM